MKSRLTAALLCSVLFTSSTFTQTTDYLSPEEIKVAISETPGKGFVHMEDMTTGLGRPSGCQAQMPGLLIYTPAGWLNALSSAAHRQYLQFEPKPEDTLGVDLHFSLVNLPQNFRPLRLRKALIKMVRIRTR